MNQFRLLYGEDILPLIGDFPVQGSHLPSFMLVDDQFNDVALAQFTGLPKAIITLLSHDEEEHGGARLLRETLRFLERWPMLQTVVITVDSPSTLRRVRKERGLPRAMLLSTLRGRDFHKHFGVLITEYPLAGYTAPAIIIADADNNVLYSERLRDTLDDFNFEQMRPAMQALEAAETAAKQQAAAAAAQAQAEAEERERQERAMIDTVRQSTPR
ncbi:MAG: redoxin domain-containing protein [Paludibacterium sp.]|uniref:redoxin domain-containing protein n=1 Tax=Paludibacterium sp. TaxID=1917523 RepID=UPI0025F79DBE|nr:redoxin domain-containing protein [Paludibacterium sp.]MBV8046470.1 redoxin domain-containing protein [Paludibacterium sp.]MBV8645878.1 redoxin domain-containing protein [Paludibacterium sp.]